MIQLENPFIAHPSADGTDVAAIVIYGWNTMGIGYVALWVF